MTSYNDTGSQPLPEPRGNGSLYEEIRHVLRRPDLSDDILELALSEHRFGSETLLAADAFLAGKGRPEERARVIRTMIVPPPLHRLDMPSHDLEPPLSRRLAPLATRWQRVLHMVRPQMKRTPAPARNR
ncbi:hypothetical protein [Labrenzia sp. 011]|uniref:hypothetical protein n=1 Tax=Labrenzia sp. 011 TaxID=2171494 RepID=UPI000D523035|nr:hypothetical protein [Labrenzia sp. 011]PVB61676.1 hypothetical protein DCO57_10890 [Labrenzia sp. 011]